MLIKIFEKSTSLLYPSRCPVSLLLFAKVNFEKIEVIYKQETPHASNILNSVSGCCLYTICRMFHFARRAAIIVCVWGSIFCLQESNATKRDTNTSVCLAMIIKNEGPILPRLFDSVRGFVSEYCVMDTGSTDDTVDVLRSIDVPGQVLHGPFINFAQARNLMIDECRKLMKSCDYFLLLDADMILKVHPEWSWNIIDDRDVYNLIQESKVEYENVRLIRRTVDKIKVVGATHEYYDVPDEYSRELISKDLIYIEDIGDGKAKGDKFERDEYLLRQDLERDPSNPRTVFYLANTLKDMKRYAEAIPLYEQRSLMDNGWWVERDYAVYMLCKCYLGLEDLSNARKYGELAARISKRAEPLYDLVYYLHHNELYTLAWYYYTLASQIPKPAVKETLFIVGDIYAFWLDFEKATLSRHIFPDQPILALTAGVSFLNNIHAPQYLREYFYREAWVESIIKCLRSTVTYHHYHASQPDIFWHSVLNNSAGTQCRYSSSGESDTSAGDVKDTIENPVSIISLSERLQGAAPFSLSNDDGGLCLKKWFPMQIGNFVRETCEVHTSKEMPRSFSFFRRTSNGVQYNGDTWFLSESYSTVDLPGSGEAGNVYYHMVAIDMTLGLKTYSLPFMFPQMKANMYQNMTLHMEEDGDIVIVFTDVKESDFVTSVVHRVSWTDIVPYMIFGREI